MERFLHVTTLLAQTTPMEQPVTFTIVPSQFLTIIIIGLIAGFFASLLIRGRTNLFVSLTIGLLGAIVGSILFSAINFQIPPSLQGGITLRYIDIIVSFIGALIVLAVFYVITGRRR